MIPSENGSSAPASSKSRSQEGGDDQAPALETCALLERPREELQLREGDVLVDALEDAVDVGAGLDELGREAERLRGRVRVLETARVGDDRDVERLRDLGRQLDAELAEEVAEDLARRRGVRRRSGSGRRSGSCRGGGRCR